nr:MAG: hypothetical protein J07AB56_05370 [Candidatus Nanosalinarum sp. J07AB56]
MEAMVNDSAENLSDQERRVFSYLSELEDTSLKPEMEIVNGMSMCATDVTSALESLEKKGLVEGRDHRWRAITESDRMHGVDAGNDAR